MTLLHLWEHRSAEPIVPPHVTPRGLASERRTLGSLEVRASADTADSGAFDGIALPWMTLDSYGTRFAPDAFNDGGVDSDPYALLWMHDPWTVLGTLTAQAAADGLRIQGAYDSTPEGQIGRQRAVSGSARGLSVGFERLGDVEENDGSVTIIKARLIEVSQITARMESVPGAGLAGVRAIGTPGKPAPTVIDTRGVAARLRLAGF